MGTITAQCVKLRRPLGQHKTWKNQRMTCLGPPQHHPLTLCSHQLWRRALTFSYPISDNVCLPVLVLDGLSTVNVINTCGLAALCNHADILIIPTWHKHCHVD
jgi:hypothetical protein